MVWLKLPRKLSEASTTTAVQTVSSNSHAKIARDPCAHRGFWGFEGTDGGYSWLVILYSQLFAPS